MIADPSAPKNLPLTIKHLPSLSPLSFRIPIRLFPPFLDRVRLHGEEEGRRRRPQERGRAGGADGGGGREGGQESGSEEAQPVPRNPRRRRPDPPQQRAPPPQRRRAAAEGGRGARRRRQRGGAAPLLRPTRPPPTLTSPASSPSSTTTATVPPPSPHRCRALPSPNPLTLLSRGQWIRPSRDRFLCLYLLDCLLMSNEESICPAVYLELLCLVNYFDLVP